jgi:hypothetical protein
MKKTFSYPRTIHPIHGALHMVLDPSGPLGAPSGSTWCTVHGGKSDFHKHANPQAMSERPHECLSYIIMYTVPSG